MHMKDAATALAAKGRGPDSVLVHMTPGEVAGLEALAMRHYGQGLTINPDTGLPEAGILRSILPMVAGVALAATGVGAPMAALMVGGGTALATGSLQQGLMAGLGAYGGAGMGSALAGMGTAAASAAPTAAAQTAASAVPVEEAAAAFGDIGAAGFEGTANLAGALSPGSYAPWEAGFGGTSALTDTAAGAALSPWEKMTRGVSELGKPGGFEKFSTAMGGPMGLAQKGMMGLSGAMTPEKKKFEDSDDDAMIRPYDYDQRTQTFIPRTPVAAKGFRYAAGGITDLMDTGSDSQWKPGLAPVPGSQHRAFNYDPASQAFTPVIASTTTTSPVDAAMMQEFNGYAFGDSVGPGDAAAVSGSPSGTGDTGSDGIGGGGTGDGDGGSGSWAKGGAVGIAGLLQGPGDGVSDSIPATIGGKKPAALSGGEFVVPARIVSELGNGSTDAGARKLYAMMDRIQNQRSRTVGKGRVAVNSGAERALPA